MHIVAKTQAKSKGGSEFFQNFCHNELIRRDYAVDVCVVGMFATVDSKRCRRRYEVDYVVNRHATPHGDAVSCRLED